ncbi:DUF6923 family protein [Kaistella jeonii]|uniref:DUF6923 domain-containing protein n=1 Tax=Kaistella jeonii TaxID=266749 RepID=A0A0C1CV18_9FLAO|nr:hypothetical protein [Kaistella jeonii]KIA88111.1 hypothetical protein OA86_12170 [Kaistella jeonii]SFC28284.1 hypothetical protein SAMN05421876_1121 [Kaistella jeonii]VEI96932.1 Uncharacterised protein [Kaistella jeonii]
MINFTGGAPKPLDIAYNKVDGLLYGVDNTTDNLFTINPTSGAVTFIGATGNESSFGAMYTDTITGAVYGNSNTNDAIYSFNKTSGAATLISASISATGNDGAHCVNARVQFRAELSITKTDGKTEYIFYPHFSRPQLAVS